MRRSSIFISGVAVVASVVLAQASHAAFLVNRNGVTWANTFEGDVAALTSSTPAWAVFDKNGFAAESTDGDIYSSVSGSVGTTSSYTAPSWAGSGSARTAEIRVRVPATAFEAADGAATFDTSLNDAFDLRLYHDKVAYNGTGGLTDSSNIVPLDLTQFHLLRAVVQTSSPRYRLFIDNNPTPVFSRDDAWFSGFDVLLFGDISAGGLAGAVDVDYLSWTPGAFAPEVPEPAMLGLLPMAAMLLSRKRK